MTAPSSTIACPGYLTRWRSPAVTAAMPGSSRVSARAELLIPRPPPTPGWRRAGFGSQEEAEAFKARYRAQHGPTASFPWDVG